jgi:hypothetical protein
MENETKKTGEAEEPMTDEQRQRFTERMAYKEGDLVVTYDPRNEPGYKPDPREREDD